MQSMRFFIVVLLGVLLASQPGMQAQPASAWPVRAVPVDLTAYRSAGTRHKLVVPAQAALPPHTRLLADYGSFKLIEANQATLPSQAFTVRDDYNLLLLNTGPLDTTRLEAAGQRQSVQSFSGRRLWLVQYAGPPLSEWYDQLLATGVQVVHAIPQNAYLVYGDTAQIAAVQQRVREQNGFQWEGPYAAAYRLQAGVLTDAAQYVTIQLVEDAAANAETLALIDQLRQGPAVISYALGYANIRVELVAGAVNRLVSQPDVVSIHPASRPRQMDERQSQIMAGNISGNGPATGDYLAWLSARGFTQAQFDASGFVVDITDSGIDNGTTSPNHVALRRGGTAAGTSRVAYARLEGTPNQDSTLTGIDGHGTLNAHIVGGFVPGSAPYNSFPHADGSGFRYGLGVAPFVKVGSSVIFDSVDPQNSYTFPNFTNMIARAYRDKARISSNSWGMPDDLGAYTADAQEYDALVRDAQPATAAVSTPGNQEMTIVFVSGNYGAAAGSVSAPGTAKNVLTIGASENVNPYGGVDGSGVGDSGSNNLNDIISFSGRGPTDDGRTKPDLVAPGTHITGGVAQGPNPGPNGTAIAGFVGNFVSGGTSGNKFYPAGQQWYTASSGTSHAAPAVAGAAALVRQYFINQGWNAPSPAMVKAYLVHGAAYLNGVSANDTLPSPNQGMGGVRLGSLFDANTARLLRDQVAGDLFTLSGQQRVFSGFVADATRPMRITLAWTDAPGSTVSKTLLNDLNLRVTVGSTTYLGNVFGGANSTTGGSADRRNNLESVFLPAGLPIGTPVVITVEAATILADGVPSNATPLDQDFALAVSNVAEQLIPNVIAESLTITGETYNPANYSPEPRERVTVNLVLRNTGTAGTNNVVATLQPNANITDISAAQSYGALAAGSQLVARSFSFTIVPTAVCGGSLKLSFSIVDGTTVFAPYEQTFAIGAAGMASSCMLPALYARPSTITTSEQGSSASVVVLLPGKPTAPVTITLTGNPAEGTLNTSTLLFTPTNWATSQSVVVTGIADQVFDPLTAYPLMLVASSADPAYNHQEAVVIVLNVEQFRVRLPQIRGR